MLTREQIQAVPDITRQKVPTPEWAPEGMPAHEAFVWVRGLTAEELDQFENGLITSRKRGAKPSLESMRAKLCVLACEDDQQQPLFRDGDVEWLTNKSAGPVNRIYAKIRSQTAMTDEDLEELEKNLSKIPADDSS